MSLVPELLERSLQTDAIVYTPQRPAPSRQAGARPDVESRTIRLFDPDKLGEALGSDQLEHRLLEPGPFDARLLRVNTAKLSLDIVRYSRPVALKGRWTRGKVAIVFGLNVSGCSIVQGRAFRAGALAVIDSSVAIDMRFPAHSQWAILSLDPQAFDVAGDPGRPMSDIRVRYNVPLLVRDTERRRLGVLLRATLDDAEMTGQLLHLPESAAAFERDILKAYADAVSTAEPAQFKGLAALERRIRLVNKAEDYVLAHLDESIRMDRLCKEVGASARALEYAFQAAHAMGAMRYLRTIRLNEVRKALLRSGGAGPVTVTATAMDWGFWHLGEFAATYRRLFGEAPSDTLRAAMSANAHEHSSSMP